MQQLQDRAGKEAQDREDEIRRESQAREDRIRNEERELARQRASNEYLSLVLADISDALEMIDDIASGGAEGHIDQASMTERSDLA